MEREYKINEKLEKLVCIRCGCIYNLNDTLIDKGYGCLACLRNGFPSSLELVYSSTNKLINNEHYKGLQRYSSWVPYKSYPSLGEGGTPLISIPRISKELGLETLWVKNEGQNPTGSHKDRMSVFAVARACDIGSSTVVVASSGNAGASLATYAAAADIKSIIISTNTMNSVWKRAIEMAGARILTTASPFQRWELMKEGVENEGWYPVSNFQNPPTGSNPFGVQGYKTISFEIIEQCAGRAPTAILVPTSRGDLLWGVWKGFCEAYSAHLVNEIPKMIAIEPFPRLSKVLNGVDYRAKFNGFTDSLSSIAGNTATYQSLLALKESSGCAIEINDQDAVKAQQELAHHGIYAESSSATPLAALEPLMKYGHIKRGDRIVLICTSNGYKESPV